MRYVAAFIRPVFRRGLGRSTGITKRSGICSKIRHAKAKPPLAKPAGYQMVRACACHEESQPNRDERSGEKMPQKTNGSPSQFLPWLIRLCSKQCKNSSKRTV